ncbi:MAG: N-acetylmuramoyl-L-alanine amidase [Chitinophagaceae bacterium]
MKISLVIFCSAAFLQVSAQPSGNSTPPKDFFLKGSVTTSKDSADSGDKTSISTGVGAFIATTNTNAKYNKANALYYSMIDSLSRVIFRFPVMDSAGLPYAEEWVGTPNMGLRRPNYVIIHFTANNSCEETLREFTTTGGREASAHYVISKDGTVYHMLNDLLRAHHAGESKWGNTTDINSSSVGIELDNNGSQPFPPEQMNSLITLLNRLKAAYKIPTANFIGHGDVAPTRRTDPGTKFPWKDLSTQGFGLWWDDTTGVQVPDNFDYLIGLRIIGYDISNPAAALAAFKRHFMGDNTGTMNADIRKIIYVLYQKYL